MDPFVEFRMMSELNDTIKHTLQIKRGGVEILNPEVARGVLTDRLIFNAVFHSETQIKATSRWLIKAIGQSLNIFSSSTHGLQNILNPPARKKMKTPVLQTPHLSYDIARAVFQAIQKHHMGPVIFELGESSMESENQSPGEFSATIFAAAIREEYQGPIFIQAHHIQVNTESFQRAPDKEIQKLKNLIIESIATGIYNLWINGFSISHSPQTRQVKTQNPSSQLLAVATDIIRLHEPKNLDISIGGGVKVSGDSKTFEKDIISFLDEYRENLQKIGENINGISKISFQPFEEIPTEIHLMLMNHYGLNGRVPLNSSNFSKEVLEDFSGIGGMEFPLNMPFHSLFIDHADLPENIRKTLIGSLSNPSISTNNAIKKTLWTLPDTLRENIRNQFVEKIIFFFKTFKTTNALEDLQRNTPNPKIPLSLSAEMKALQN